MTCPRLTDDDYAALGWVPDPFDPGCRLDMTAVAAAHARGLADAARRRAADARLLPCSEEVAAGFRAGGCEPW